MKKAVRIGLILLAVLLLVGVGAFLLRPSRQPTTVASTDLTTTAIVALGSIEETISATGNVAAERQATLSFQSSGVIAELLITEGQQVEAGQVLARLDTSSLQEQVARAQASLDTARARLAQAQQPASASDLASAQAALDSARAGYDKAQAGPTAGDLASAQASLASAKANYAKVKAGPTKADLASARAALDSARAALQQAQANYDLVKDRPDVQMLPQALSLQNATIEFQRAQANYDAAANHPTASELAAAVAQVAQAEATLAQLQERPTASELAAAAAQVAQAEATLAQLQARPDAEDVAVTQSSVTEAQVALAQAQAQLEDAVLTAPFSGAILTIQFEQGEWASPGQPAVVLATTDPPLRLDMNVDEVDVARLAEGQLARLTFEALPGQEVTGTVTHIAPTATNAGGAVAYGVKISFDPGRSTELPVRLGMTADVKIVVARADGVLLVPNRAITADREAGRYYVTRQRAGGATERLEVRIGLRDGSQTQILEGLDEGDRLVLPEVPAQGTTSQEFQGPFGGAMRQGGQ
jgi:HlyD family secretion protein